MAALAKRLQQALLARRVILSRTGDPSEVVRLVERCRVRPTATPLVRLGEDGDGGYLVPDDLDGIAHCFSPGVNDQISFESDLLRRGIASSLADFSTDRPHGLDPALDFERCFVGARDAPGMTTLASWIGRRAPERGDLLLQMDIEGAEYAALLALPDALLERFRIIVVEFHHLNKLFDPLVMQTAGACLEKLLDRFDVVHLHPNNGRPVYQVGPLSVPEAMEFTFHRKDRVRPTDATPAFPHPLDADCVPGAPAVVLPRVWRPD